MTPQEKIIKKYVDNIKHHLQLSHKMKSRISYDLLTDINSRIEKGETLKDIMASMGTPKEVADGFNDELSQYQNKKNPWRFVFLFLTFFTGVGIIYNLIDNYWVRDSIGGADGPTSISVSQVIPTPFWLLISFVLGCLATYFLLKCNKNSHKKDYTIVVILSISALTVFILGLIFVSIDYYLNIKDITSFLFMVVQSILFPSFWLPLITLIISLRKRKIAKP